MTATLAQSVDQAKQLAGLFSKRADALETLKEVDTEIDAIQSGKTAPKRRGRPAGSKAKAKAATATKTTGKKRGRPPGSKNKTTKEKEKTTVAATGEKKTRKSNKVSMKKLLLQLISRRKSGIDIEGLTEGCHKAGFESRSGVSPKGYVQNIRTNLNSLMNDGEIVKDDNKKYHAVEKVAPTAEAA